MLVVLDMIICGLAGLGGVVAAAVVVVGAAMVVAGAVVVLVGATVVVVEGVVEQLTAAIIPMSRMILSKIVANFNFTVVFLQIKFYMSTRRGSCLQNKRAQRRLEAWYMSLECID